MLKLNSFLCTDCGACIPVCHVTALRIHVDGIEINQETCDLCDICVKICPTEALFIERQHEKV